MKTQRDRGLVAWGWILCIIIPWINPFVPGPSGSVGPWLVSALMAALLVLLSARAPVALAHPDGIAGLLARAWLAAALVSSVIALCQYFAVAHHFQPFMQSAPAGEAYGNLRQRNQLASLTSIGVASVLWLAVRGCSTGVALGCLLLLAAANAASASRVGALQLLMVSAMACIWPGPHRRKLVGFCGWLVLAYLAVTFSLPGSGAFGRAMQDIGCGSRSVLWANVLDLIAQKPLWGWGWNELAYAHFITLYPGGRFCDILDNAHNLPMHLAVELGIPVAVAACALLLWFVARGAPWREEDPARRMAWMVLVVIMLHSMVEYPLWYGPFQMAVGLCICLLWRPPIVAPAWKLGAGAVIVASVAYAGWDYRRVSQIYLPPEQRAAAYRDDTLAKIRDSWLFRNQVRFAEVTTTVLARDNAARVADEAARLLHYSPEPRVIELLIDSLVVLHSGEVPFYMERYRAAFPADYAAWAQRHAQEPLPAGVSAR